MNVSSLLVGLRGGVVRAECRREDRENATGYVTFGIQMLVKGRKVSLDHARDKMGRASRGWKLKLKLTFWSSISTLTWWSVISIEGANQVLENPNKLADSIR